MKQRVSGALETSEINYRALQDNRECGEGECVGVYSSDFSSKRNSNLKYHSRLALIFTFFILTFNVI